MDRIQGTAIKKCKVQEIRIFRKKFRKTLEKTKKVHEEVIDFPINSTYNRKVLQNIEEDIVKWITKETIIKIITITRTE